MKIPVCHLVSGYLRSVKCTKTEKLFWQHKLKLFYLLGLNKKVDFLSQQQIYVSFYIIYLVIYLIIYLFIHSFISVTTKHKASIFIFCLPLCMYVCLCVCVCVFTVTLLLHLLVSTSFSFQPKCLPVSVSVSLFAWLLPSILDKIFRTKWSNPGKLDMKRKVWYLF